jgi:hypothetical protein
MLQTPVFVPFIGCFCGALAYDMFIYTGDSPITNGEWTPKRLWDSLLVKLGIKEKKRQGDEDNLEEKRDHEEEDLGPSPIAGLHNRTSIIEEKGSDKSSDITRSGIQGTTGSHQPGQNTVTPGTRSTPQSPARESQGSLAKSSPTQRRRTCMMSGTRTGGCESTSRSISRTPRGMGSQT